MMETVSPGFLTEHNWSSLQKVTLSKDDLRREDSFTSRNLEIKLKSVDENRKSEELEVKRESCSRDSYSKAPTTLKQSAPNQKGLKKEKSFVSRNIGGKVETLEEYKRRAEMQQKRESNSGGSNGNKLPIVGNHDFTEERFASKSNADKLGTLEEYEKKVAEFKEKRESNSQDSSRNTESAGESSKVPPNSPTNADFECWDYFSSIFFQLFPGVRKDVRQRNDRVRCRLNQDGSIQACAECEWRECRRHLTQESIDLITTKKERRDKISLRENIILNSGIITSLPELEKPVPPKLAHSYGKQTKLVLPQKPKNPFSPRKGPKHEKAVVFESMRKAYEAIKNTKYKKYPGTVLKSRVSLEKLPKPVPVKIKREKQEILSWSEKEEEHFRENLRSQASAQYMKEEKDIDQRHACVCACAVTSCLKTQGAAMSNRENKSQRSLQKPETKFTMATVPKKGRERGKHLQTKSIEENLVSEINSSPKPPNQGLVQRNAEQMNKYNTIQTKTASSRSSSTMRAKQFGSPVVGSARDELAVSLQKPGDLEPMTASKFAFERKDYDIWSRDRSKYKHAFVNRKSWKF